MLTSYSERGLLASFTGNVSVGLFSALRVGPGAPRGDLGGGEEGEAAAGRGPKEGRGRWGFQGTVLHSAFVEMNHF